MSKYLKLSSALPGDALIAAGEKRLNKAPLPFGVLEGDGGE